jgi:Colicin/Pyocin-S2, DNase domain
VLVAAEPDFKMPACSAIMSTRLDQACSGRVWPMRGMTIARAPGICLASDDFREAFWTEVGHDSEPSAGFGPGNIDRMRKGGAPFVVIPQQYGPGMNYVLHHVEPIQHGGGVYDMDNLVVVTPLYHSQILKPSLHYGNG